MFGFSFLKECTFCGSSETRLFTDSWSGQELCLECLSSVAAYVTMSPEEEGDNLVKELEARVGSPE